MVNIWNIPLCTLETIMTKHQQSQTYDFDELYTMCKKVYKSQNYCFAQLQQSWKTAGKQTFMLAYSTALPTSKIWKLGSCTLGTYRNKCAARKCTVFFLLRFFTMVYKFDMLRISAVRHWYMRNLFYGDCIHHVRIWRPIQIRENLYLLCSYTKGIFVLLAYITLPYPTLCYRIQRPIQIWENLYLLSSIKGIALYVKSNVLSKWISLMINNK